MAAVVLFFLLGFILLDFAFLKKQDPECFIKIFRIPLPAATLGAGLFALVTLVIEKFFPVKGMDDVFSVLFVLVFLTYIFHRVSFKRSLPWARKDAEVLGLGLSLLLDAITIVLVWFLWTLGVGLLLKAVAEFCPVFGSDLDEMVVTAVLAQVILLILIIKCIRRYPTLGFRQATGLIRNRQPLWKFIFLPLAIGGMLATAGAWFLMTRASQPVTPLSEAVSSSTSSVGLAAFLMVAVFLAPFIEEIIFRGFFFLALDKGAGRLWAVGIITVVFALLHVEQYWGDWMAIIIVAFLGLILTLFRSWTGSSIPGIIIHYVFNGLMTLIPIMTLVMSNPSYSQYQQGYKQLSFVEKQTLLQKSISEQPDFAAAYNDLAWLYAENNYDLAEALRLIEEALSREPESFAYLDTKAEVLFKMGDSAGALAIAESLANKYPSNAYARKQLEKFVGAGPARPVNAD